VAEIPIEIPVQTFSLEGLCEEKGGSEGALICHPHPLYGGSMDNNVVVAVRKAFRSWGVETLRFNFRGVGSSGGEYGDGEGEVDDVLAASSYLASKGKTALHLAGYSFGAWVVLKALKRGLKPASLTLVSPPVDFLSFDGLRPPSIPCLVTVGGRDAFCSVQSLKNWIAPHIESDRMLEIEVFPRCDHFYGGMEPALSSRIVGFLKNHFSAHTV
jgi:alpha/beta superfamily hydrolase